MGSVVPGTGGTLKSNTIENSLYEALVIASNWENDIAKNPSGEKRIALITDTPSKLFNANFTLKIARELTATGVPSFPVQSQLIGTGYTAGSGGAIVSGNIYAAIVEICEEIQKREAIAAKNPLNLNGVTELSYNSETLTVAGSVTLSIDTTTDATGNVVSRARAYLVD